MTAKQHLQNFYDRLVCRLEGRMAQRLGAEIQSRDAELRECIVRVENKLDHVIASYGNVERFIYSLNTPLARQLRDETRVTKLITSTAEGEFVFDVADEVLGWNMANGGWEPEETAFVKSVLVSGDLMIDAGANLGWYSVVAAKAVGETGVVVAFEPDGRNFELLNTNVMMHGVQNRVKPFPQALLDKDGEVALELSTDNFGDHRIQMDRSGSTGGERKTATVAARRLDVVLDELHLSHRPIRLYKLDTQGSEVAVLQGSPSALDRTEYVLVEFSPGGLRRSGSSMEAFRDQLISKFSSFSRLSSGAPVFRPVSQFDSDMRKPMDLADGDADEAHTNYVFRK